MKWSLGILLLLLAILGGFQIWNTSFKPDSLLKKKLAPPPNKNFWLENDDILIYLETIIHIKNHNVYVLPEKTRPEILKETIQSYLEKIDRYAAYLSAEDYQRWKKSQADNFVGIGMNIEKNKLGQVVCMPYPNSPAEQAGIRSGNYLTNIDGEPIQGKSILTIGSMARGNKNTKVNLTIVTSDGEEKQFTVKRSDVQFETVNQSQIDDIPVIKINAFTHATNTKLKSVLDQLNKNKPIILDLRGNAGGDLFAAIDSVMFFLEPHKKIVSINTRQGIEQFESDKEAINLTSPLFIWQDQGTASAAEVFIAALTDNKRAISIGKKSFGKGTKQEIFELNNGAALFITTGYLQTPNGIKFDGKGLKPDYFIKSSRAQTQDYFIQVKNLLEQKSNSDYPREG